MVFSHTQKIQVATCFELHRSPFASNVQNRVGSNVRPHPSGDVRASKTKHVGKLAHLSLELLRFLAAAMPKKNDPTFSNLHMQFSEINRIRTESFQARCTEFWYVIDTFGYKVETDFLSFRSFSFEIALP